MPSRSSVFALFLLSIMGTHSVASAQAPPPDADDLQEVRCHLAPRIRSIGGTTRSVPGRVVWTTKADCNVRGGLEVVRKLIPSSLAGLHAFRCGEARCYSSSEVAGAVDRIREQVRQAIPPQAAALALAVDADLDRASQLGEALPINPIQLVRSRPDNASGYHTNTVADVFSKLEEVLDHVLSYDRLAPTLTIRSNPEFATFEMYVGSAAIANLSGVTNMQLPNVWRGRYEFKASLAGRKTVSQIRIDLMNGTPKRVSCELVPDPGSGVSFCKVEQ